MDDWLSDTNDFLDPYGDAADPTENDAVLRGADLRLAAEIEQWQLEDDERHYGELIERRAKPGPSNDGRPNVDGSAARRRVDAIRKGDILQLAAAYDALHEMRGAGKPATNDLRLEAGKIDGAPAPRTFRELGSALYANQPYAVHRLCSALVHSGLGMSRISRVPLATVS